MYRASFCVFGLTAALLISSCGAPANNTSVVGTNANSMNRPPASPLPSATIDELASGRRIYQQNCQACHKETGKGGPVEIEGKQLNPDDLTSEKIKKFSDEKILGYIMNGIEDEGMPAFKGKLSEAEMRDVLKFIRVELQNMPASSAASRAPGPSNASPSSGAPAGQ